MTTLRLALCAWLACSYALAQTTAQQSDSVPLFRVNVVARTTRAINYNHRSGSTKVDMIGTALLPESRGTAQVASKQGSIHVETELKHLRPASMFGPEYVTYVLWAISPEGRPVNLGEVLLNGDGKTKFDVTSNLQTFALIVTAEPYFAVTMPSDVVVMENEIRNDTLGTIEQVDAKYELLPRGQYEVNVNPSELQPMPVGGKTPIELYEARNAVRIAKWTGAEQYAAESLRKAEDDLQNAEGYDNRHSRKAEITNAREAVQMAEDARIITLKKQDAERQANERQAAADAAAQAQTQADAALQQKQQAEAQAEQARADAAAAQAAAQQAQQQAQQAQQQAQQAQQNAQQAEQDKAAMRAQLAQQLNAILETRDSARGLIVNMSDVLFDTGKYTLKPGAREKLAKVAGILLAYPGLTVEVDGHTDNVGGDDFNQTLSEQRASGVRDYLVQQGVSANAVSAKGFGKTEPVASNDNAAGRQMNRRVELVVAGALIGATAGATPIDPAR